MRAEADSSMEIKEWQAIMQYLKTQPKKNDEGICLLVMDERTIENRTINLQR